VVLFILDVEPDAHGNETSWKLYDKCNNALVDGGSGNMQSKEAVVMQLDVNKAYKLIILDASGDGLCPEDGPNGNLTLSVDGEVVDSAIFGPCFGSKLSYSFGECGVQPLSVSYTIGV
jgi:hypothetical protein